MILPEFKLVGCNTGWVPKNWCFYYYYYFILFFNFTIWYWFCHISTWIHHTCSPSWTLLPPPSPYHPSGSSQCTSPKHPVSCTVVLEKTLESPLDCKEIQPVHSEGDQPWVFFGRNDAKAETPVLWPPHAKSWPIGKDADAGRDWEREEKGTTEAEMAGWHHRLNGREFEWTPGDGDGQGGLVSCDSWGCKESDRTERLNWTELINCCILTSFLPRSAIFAKETTFSSILTELWNSRKMKTYLRCLWIADSKNNIIN